MEDHRDRAGKKGRLYLVATPIGNLEDLTFRGLRILGQVDAVACEDTRQTIKLLNRYGLRKKLISYYAPREGQKLPLIMSLLESGRDVALVSDAGTPGISDPGFRLIREAIRAQIPVIPVPGASALTAALAASGLPSHRFLFLGFPSPGLSKLKKLLRSVSREQATLIFFLPLRRLAPFLEVALEELGDREAVIAREMTKVHEEFLRGQLSRIIQEVRKKARKGEATVLIEGCREPREIGT